MKYQTKQSPGNVVMQVCNTACRKPCCRVLNLHQNSGCS